MIKKLKELMEFIHTDEFWALLCIALIFLFVILDLIKDITK